MLKNLLGQFLEQALTANQLAINLTVRTQLVAYLDLLVQWNKVFNLTAIRDPKEMVKLHIVDSVAIAPYIHGTSIIDVGTGAGLPGIPLALVQPEKKFVLLDSNGKKTRFLMQVVLTLGLPNVEVVQARVEDYHAAAGFDSILSRAFASLSDMVAKTRHLVSADGQFLAMKGVYPTEELSLLPANIAVLAVHKQNIIGLHAERHLVCLKELTRA